ncbi:hypothetical protein HK102_000087, partial [Quaeritorhiza haematococci]
MKRKRTGADDDEDEAHIETLEHPRKKSSISWVKNLLPWNWLSKRKTPSLDGASNMCETEKEAEEIEEVEEVEEVDVDEETSAAHDVDQETSEIEENEITSSSSSEKVAAVEVIDHSSPESSTSSDDKPTTRHKGKSDHSTQFKSESLKSPKKITATHHNVGIFLHWHEREWSKPQLAEFSKHSLGTVAFDEFAFRTAWKQRYQITEQENFLCAAEKGMLRLVVFFPWQSAEVRQRYLELAKQHIPSYGQIVQAGYEGSKEQFSELVNYAAEVYKATAKGAAGQKASISKPPRQQPIKAVEITKLEAEPPPPISKEKRAEEEPWLKTLREKIQQALSSKPEYVEEPTKLVTPAYEALLKNKMTLEDEIKHLQIKEKEAKEAKKKTNNFPALSEKAMAKVQAALRGPDGTVVDAFNVEMQKSDIQTLIDGRWLNDE